MQVPPPTSQTRPAPDGVVRVVLFSGGRGSGSFATQLVGQPGIELTIAINGYDDGASTGEVRRFLGDALGPSDFRKNAARLAADLGSCPADLLRFLEQRLPLDCTPARAADIVSAVDREPPAGERHAAIVHRLRLFFDEVRRRGGGFDFSDCSVGNLVFAGSFLHVGRAFNAAVEDYSALLGVPDGLIQNVTDGANAFLVAIDRQGNLLWSEEQIVDSRRRNDIEEIFLLGHPPSADDRAAVAAGGAAAARAYAAAHAVLPRLNPVVGARLGAADVIIYAPGTQHSSLFPSYLTEGLGTAIARNLNAVKLLITNIQADAEIPERSAVDLVERALFYLRDKGQAALPAPCLITHYLLNDAAATSGSPYVPLGRIDRLEDPRLVRIGNYEDGVTGRHDAARVLSPFIRSLSAARRRARVAVLLHDDDSLNKVAQTLLEIVRGGIEGLPVDLEVYHGHRQSLDAGFVASLPFRVHNLGVARAALGSAFREVVESGRFEYVVLFESSGMYRGEDVVVLLSPLRVMTLDAVWGSRRLSVRDIEASYRLQYRHNLLLGAVSYVGSHVLSMLYLLLYGRYVSDTLSGARCVRTACLLEPRLDPLEKGANHVLLSGLLRERAELLEMPVRFFPLSPHKVRRTSIGEGLRALATIVRGRLRARGRVSPPAVRPRPGHADSDVRAERV